MNADVAAQGVDAEVHSVDPEADEAAEPWEDSLEPGHVDGADHDDTGLDLALQIARSVSAGPAPTPRAKRPKRSRRRFDGPSYDDAREPNLLGDVFGRLLHDRGWNVQVNVHLLLGNWPRLVGQTNADHSEPEKFEDGILVVRTTSTAWATQLRLIAPNLVARLNAELGHGTVTAIHVRGPEAPSWKHGPRSVPGRGPRDTYG